jgi:hypothetical protein
VGQGRGELCGLIGTPARASPSPAQSGIESRNARIDGGTHALVVASSQEIFGDPDARFIDLVSLIIDTAGALL